MACTRNGRRSSTYQAFLAGEPEQRPNLAIITGAQATRVLLEGEAGLTVATGVEYRTTAGETLQAHARREVIVSAGAIGSPHLLLLSGIGPRHELDAHGVPCLVERQLAVIESLDDGPRLVGGLELAFAGGATAAAKASAVKPAATSLRIVSLLGG